jgi:hypothetical protein
VGGGLGKSALAPRGPLELPPPPHPHPPCRPLPCCPFPQSALLLLWPIAAACIVRPVLDFGLVSQRESNARIVEWADGSRHLFIGKHAFEFHRVDITPEHTFLYRQHVRCAALWWWWRWWWLVRGRVQGGGRTVFAGVRSATLWCWCVGSHCGCCAWVPARGTTLARTCPALVE